MRRFRTIYIFALAATISLACTKERAVPGQDFTGITFQFDCGSFPETKAKIDSAGVDKYNENLLNSVEYFLYPDNGTGSDAVFHGYLVDVEASTKVYSVPMTDDLVNSVLCPGSSRFFKVYAIANYPRRIVQQAATEDLSHTSVAELEALTRDLDMGNDGVATPQSSFFMSTNGAFRVGPVDKHATNVVNARVPLERVPAKITILVRLEESVTIPNTVVINGVSDVRNEVWTPRPGEMQVYLVNGSLTGRASGQPIPDTDPNLFTPFTYPTLEFDDNNTEEHSYSTFEPVFDNENNVVDYTETPHSGTFVSCEAPFYTNPVSWEYGSSLEPYIKLMVPWDRQPGVSTGGVSYGTASKNYYYRIYCPGDPIDGTHAQFIRNNWYKIVLNVGVLGSDTDGGESIIHGKYYVVDWQEREDTSGGGSGSSGSGVNDSDKEAEIRGARYLFINKEEYELFNVDELTIPYTTSDPCEIVSITGKYYIFNGTSKQEQTIDASSWLSLSSVGGAHIQFTHTLNNDTSRNDYDTSEYSITFTLRQKDNTSYAKQITIHQYPAIMIDLERNTNTTSSQYYATYVNASQSSSFSGNSSSNTYFLGSQPGSGTSSNNNYNMVIIQTTVLPEGSSYMLGDPRVMDIDNLNANWPNNNNTGAAATEWSANTSSVQGTTRRLSYYYPVDHSSKANNIIAPKFRIASSRGATQPMTYANAFRRCASYQEFGYPGGRWRLPTVAEIQYIAKLNSDEKIERLLGGETITYSTGWGGSQARSDTWQASKTDSDCYTLYWCNSGSMKVYNGKKSNWVTNNGGEVPAPEISDTGVSGTNYVRCVYDDWYWNGLKLNGNDVSTVSPITTFKWGDITR